MAEKCPYCGEREMRPEKMVELCDGDEWEYWAMQCMNCDSRGPSATDSNEAIELYNELYKRDEAEGAAEERFAILAKVEEMHDDSIGSYPEAAAHILGWNGALDMLEAWLEERGQS